MAKKRARIKKVLSKEVHLPAPKSDSKALSVLTKNRSIMPSYFVQSWRELKKVTWPGRKESWQLVMAVILFTAVFTIITAFADLGFSELVERIIL